MDNEELKKKIVDVLRDNREYKLQYYPDDNYTEVVIDYEAIADALIAAGFGDVTEWKHRSEVAERALINMTKKYNKAERKIATTKDGWFSRGEAQIALLANDAIKQAENELAEEKER